jgi:riboflavin biosynthesis pyrimidine reductase
VLFVTEKHVAREREFARTSEIVRIRKARAAADIIRELARRGVENLLVEGGGGVMWDFARADLLDRLYLTLTPKILGGTEAPTLVDGAGFTPAQVPSFKLKACRRVGQELYLTYDR